MRPQNLSRRDVLGDRHLGSAETHRLRDFTTAGADGDSTHYHRDNEKLAGCEHCIPQKKWLRLLLSNSSLHKEQLWRGARAAFLNCWCVNVTDY